jgi:hypothetical protein
LQTEDRVQEFHAIAKIQLDNALKTFSIPEQGDLLNTYRDVIDTPGNVQLW